jgi:hypothetical protein
MNNPRDGTENRSPAAHGADISQRAASFFAGPWPLMVLLLLATLPYIGILRNDFAYTYDDRVLILDNPYVHNFSICGKY